MMKQTRISLDPVSDMSRFAEMMERMFAPVEAVTSRGSVPMDILEVDGSLVVRASIPGIRPEDINITVEGNVLTLSGEYKNVFEDKDAKVYRMENTFGTFTRSLRLPKDAEADRIEADFDNGVVTITIPRAEPAKPQPKRVPIRHARSIESNVQSGEQAEEKA